MFTSNEFICFITANELNGIQFVCRLKYVMLSMLWQSLDVVGSAGAQGYLGIRPAKPIKKRKRWHKLYLFKLWHGVYPASKHYWCLSQIQVTITCCLVSKQQVIVSDQYLSIEFDYAKHGIIGWYPWSNTLSPCYHQWYTWWRCSNQYNRIIDPGLWEQKQ